MSLCFDDNIEKRRLPSASEIILNPRYENMGFIRDSYDRLDGGYTDHNTKSNGEPYKKLSEITASSLSSAYHNPFTHHLYEDLRFSDDESVVSSVPGSPMTARSHSVKSKASTHGTFTRQLNLFIGEEWENVQPHTQDFQRKAFSCPSSPQTKRNITVTKQPGTKGDDTEELTPSESKHRSYDHVKQFFLDMPIEPPAPKHFRLEPNPHNTINHMCHSALHCPCFLFFCFLCCLPGVYYMLQGDKSYKCGKEEKAIIYGKRSTILYVIGTILAIVLLGGVVFFAVLFVQDQVG